MKPFFCMLLLFSAIGYGCLAQGSQSVEETRDQKAVAAAVEGLRKALIDPDKTILQKLSLPQLSYGHSSGVVQDQTEFIEALTSGRSDFVSIALTNQTISVVGNAAVVRHILSANTNDGGKPGQVKLSILLVWQKTKGEWRLLARQAVKAQ